MLKSSVAPPLNLIEQIRNVARCTDDLSMTAAARSAFRQLRYRQSFFQTHFNQQTLPAFVAISFRNLGARVLRAHKTKIEIPDHVRKLRNRDLRIDQQAAK